MKIEKTRRLNNVCKSITTADFLRIQQNILFKIISAQGKIENTFFFYLVGKARIADV